MIVHLQRHLSAKARAKRDLTAIDRIMMVASVIYPAIGLPQLVEIYQSHSASDVSLVTWLAFVIFSALFCVYGIAHRVWPVVITQGLWLIIDSGVTIGILIYN